MSENLTSINYAGGTDTGKVRQQNEDSILLCNFEHSDVILLLVADGVGGYDGGEVASKLAVESIKDYVAKAVLQACSGGGYGADWLHMTLQHGIAEANQLILQQQSQQPHLRKMATTIVALLIHQNEMAMSHLGDSRCYRFNNLTLSQITEDHTVLQKMLNEGKINHQLFEVLPMHNVISKALGLTDQPEIYVNRFEFAEDTTYLLCSDGLTNCISDDQIRQVLVENIQLDNCVDELITQANDNGGADNISVVLVNNRQQKNG